MGQAQSANLQRQLQSCLPGWRISGDVLEDVDYGFTGDGRELHRTVPPTKWCLTKYDLVHLKRVVWKAICNGRIFPTEDDDFDIQDQRHGPNMYTVNDQFIRPVTATYGNMSWALMRHPEGLLCDLFITHAWSEGIFEFIDKVLASWPRGCNNAYICVFSNPQNLDITSMIRTPASSPFAKALQVAPILLVVPNSRTSIYTRLWCSYEAYIAYRGGKTILSARAPVWHVLWVPLLNLLVFGCLGALLGKFLPICNSSLPGWVDLFVCHQGEALATFLVGDMYAFLMLFAGLILTRCDSKAAEAISFAIYLGVLILWPLQGAYLLMQGDPSTFFICCIMQMLLPMIFNDMSTTEELDFRGSITTASCSVPQDRNRILEEIRDGEIEVNNAIKNLMNYGMWTRSLGIVYAQQAEVMTNATGRVRLFIFYVLWTVLCFSHPQFLDATTLWIMQACPVVWFLSRSLSPPDEKLFATSAMVNIVECILVGMLLINISDEYATLTWNPWYVIWCIFPIASLLICVISLLGLGRTVHIPFIGPPCARMVLNSNPYMNLLSHLLKTCDCQRRRGQETMPCRMRLRRMALHIAEIACVAAIWGLMTFLLSKQPSCAVRLKVEGPEAADHHCILGNYSKSDLFPAKQIRRRPFYENERVDCKYKMYMYFKDELFSPGGGNWYVGFRTTSGSWFWSARAQSVALCPEDANNWFSDFGPVGVYFQRPRLSLSLQDANSTSFNFML